MRKQGDIAASNPEAARIIPRLAVGLAHDIPRLAPGGFLSLVQ